MNNLFLNEHRCKCGKLLLKGIFFDSTLEIKCKKCGEITRIGNIKLADDATHYLLIINDKGTLVNASDSACRILGYTHEELIGKNFTLINPTIPKEIGKKFFGPESVLNENNYLKLDTFHQTKDGKNIPVTVLLKMYKPNIKDRYVLLSASLSKVESASEKVISPKETLDFLNHGCDFWFELDTNGVGEYVSSSVKKIFGFPPEAIIGKNYFDYLPAETRAETKKTFIYYSSLEQPFRIVHNSVLDIKGKVMHSELFFTPKFDDMGKFTGYRVLGWVIKSS